MNHIWQLWSFNDCLPFYTFFAQWSFYMVAKKEIRKAPAGKENPFKNDWPFTLEFLKWTRLSLNLDTSILAMKCFSQKSLAEWRTNMDPDKMALWAFSAGSTFFCKGSILVCRAESGLKGYTVTYNHHTWHQTWHTLPLWYGLKHCSIILDHDLYIMV